MSWHSPFGTIVWLFAVVLTSARAGAADANRIVLGQLTNGADVAFVSSGSGDWGIEISGGAAASMTQPKPAQIEVFRGQERVKQLAAGYQSVRKDGGTIDAKANVVSEDGAAFYFEDHWGVSGMELALVRKVTVTGGEDNAGFYSAIRFSSDPSVKWEDVKCFMPGLLYGDSSHAGGSAPTSTSNYSAKRLTIREDYLSAPLLGISFKDGKSSTRTCINNLSKGNKFSKNTSLTLTETVDRK